MMKYKIQKKFNAVACDLLNQGQNGKITTRGAKEEKSSPV
jgi:hypothetical protein